MIRPAKCALPLSVALTLAACAWNGNGGWPDSSHHSYDGAVQSDGAAQQDNDPDC